MNIHRSMVYFGILAVYAVLVAIFIASFASKVANDIQQAGSVSDMLQAIDHSQASLALPDEASSNENNESLTKEGRTQERVAASPLPAAPYAMINGSYIALEIADTADERSQGLSGRSSLGANAGMLFVFDNQVQPGFWMNDMNFALDIVWIRGTTIVDITENIPPPAPDEALEIYYPNTPADKVLEVNAGWVAAHGGREALLNSAIVIALP